MLLLLPCLATAQDTTITSAPKASYNYVDSAKLSLSKANDDTAKVLLLIELSSDYLVYQADTSISYAQRAISLARQLNYKKGEAQGMWIYGYALWIAGNYDKAIEVALKALDLYKGLQDVKMIAGTYLQLAVLYRDIGDYNQALKYVFLSKKTFDPLILPPGQSLILSSIYLLTNQIDSASFYIKEASDLAKQYQIESGDLQDVFGDIEVKEKNYKKALSYYWSGIPIAINQVNYLDLVYLYNSIAQLYYETGNIDSSVYYAKKVLN
ncbi:MAG: tetratricopeptide repeat protein, partial [Bacteroidota bacterium]|nr:tetratricopeptide repeat protein [Bacteroidota bacterium]